MLLIQKNKLTPSALKNPDDPMHIYALEFDKGVKVLNKRFPEGKITFKVKGYPKFVEGIDSKGREVKEMLVPPTPTRLPLQTNFKHPERGTEHWACCRSEPEVLPGNLWGIGKNRSYQIEDQLIVNLKTDPDFAYYLCYISNIVKSGQLYIYDPKAEVKEKADQERSKLETKVAIWNVLSDDAQLRKVAQAYGIADAMKKESDTIRFELESLLEANNEKQKRDPSVKGTKEFLEELKINDNVRLRAFIRNGIDNSFIRWYPDGRYKVGDKPILQVPQQEIHRKFDYMCNYFAAPNNVDKLQVLMRDLVNKEYLDGIDDPKDFRWLAKVMAIDGFYNKPEEQVKTMVYSGFGVV